MTELPTSRAEYLKKIMETGPVKPTAHEGGMLALVTLEEQTRPAAIRFVESHPKTVAALFGALGAAENAVERIAAQASKISRLFKH